MVIACHDSWQGSAEGPLSASSSPGQRRAATAVEYLFVISLIMVVAFTTIGFFGQRVKQMAEGNNTAIENAAKGPQ